MSKTARERMLQVLLLPLRKRSRRQEQRYRNSRGCTDPRLCGCRVERFLHAPGRFPGQLYHSKIAPSDVVVKAAHVALMRDDWRLVPGAIRTGRRTFNAIQQNLAFALLYNVIGIALAAIGWLPPVLAAAAQSLPDVAIMLNSSRLLRPPIPS